MGCCRFPATPPTQMIQNSTLSFIYDAQRGDGLTPKVIDQHGGQPRPWAQCPPDRLDRLPAAAAGEIRPVVRGQFVVRALLQSESSTRTWASSGPFVGASLISRASSKCCVATGMRMACHRRVTSSRAAVCDDAEVVHALKPATSIGWMYRCRCAHPVIACPPARSVACSLALSLCPSLSPNPPRRRSGGTPCRSQTTAKIGRKAGRTCTRARSSASRGGSGPPPCTSSATAAPSCGRGRSLSLPATARTRAR